MSSLCIGFADLFARRVVNASSSLTTAVALQVVAVITAVVSIIAFGGTYLTSDLILGLISGIGLGCGMITYYGGIARSSATVVSPLVAVLSAVIPFGYTVITGADPSTWAYVGAAVAIAGLVLITAAGGPATQLRTGLIWGTISGVAYGLAFVVILEASDDAGSWPALTQRLGAAIFVIGFALKSRASLIPPVGVRLFGLLGGFFAGLCTILYLIGVRADAPAAIVTASMFPAASVAIGRIFFHDAVSRLQVIGIAISLAGIAGVVLG